jgi:thiamine-phosphate pyrophosphorylase
MQTRKTLGRGLYAIADVDLLRRRGLDLDATLEALAASGAPVVQLRFKEAPGGALLEAARALVAACRRRGLVSVVNDRADVAAAAGADGVHLGQDDLPVAAARALLPKGAVVGQSTHDLDQIEGALAMGADYVGFGPVFGTRTKSNPDPVVGTAGLAEAVRKVRGRVPVVAIGGIGLETIGAVAEAGADLAAVISDVLGHPDPGERARTVHQAFLAAGKTQGARS